MINLPVKAEWREGKGIVIVDAKGDPVKATYGATADNRTCYGYIPELGFFGWQWPSPPLPFKNLVNCIKRAEQVAIFAGVVSDVKPIVFVHYQTAVQINC